MVGCTGAHFALPSYRRKPMITFLSCKWFLSANESIGVRSLSELQSEHSVQVAMMAARKAELAQKQKEKSAKPPLSSKDDEELLPTDDDDETSEEEYVDIDIDQEELDAGRTADDHESLASRRARFRPGGQAPTQVDTRGQSTHERPVGSMRGDIPKKKKIAHKPHVGQRSYEVDLGDFADREEGFFEEGELPLSPVFTGSDNMDSFMEQMCDALRDGSLGIDLNIDLGQVNSVEPTVPYSGISTSDDTLLKHGERESSVLAADVAMEKPAEGQIFHDVGFKEQRCATVPGSSGPDAGLLADMLAEQATRRTVGPPFESDSFIGIYPIPFILPDLLSD
ncbi:uncharacterized protein LOC109821082 [Asparagus officinalis]|uniref:uncharacterized protein LOC109821082 n=1 Tax=Asparagus officinalis TaxID=4686 RepID=UPI00098E285F|nr:uncharacterized protein LOC109821082 [Asparagus officinalis]